MDKENPQPESVTIVGEATEKLNDIHKKVLGLLLELDRDLLDGYLDSKLKTQLKSTTELSQKSTSQEDK